MAALSTFWWVPWDYFRSSTVDFSGVQLEFFDESVLWCDDNSSAIRKLSWSYIGIFLEILSDVTVVWYFVTFFLPVVTDPVFVVLIAVCVGPVLVTESIHLNQIKVPVHIPVFLKGFFGKNKKHLLSALYHPICFSFRSTKSNLWSQDS